MKKEDGVFIIDSLSNIRAYAGLGENFAKAVEFLSRKNLATLPIGRYAIDGDKAYASVQEAPLKAWGTGRPEVHHRYFDIQLPLSGEETIGIGRLDAAATGDFDEERDVGFYDTPVEPYTFKPGEFAIFHPNTCAHAPCCTTTGAQIVRKIVVKILK